MDIACLGHSCFKLRSSSGSLVFDPFDKSIGLPVPKASADVVCVSHGHHDHSNVAAVLGTARREEPVVIDGPGEYEVAGISVFGFRSFHDKKQGAERGVNTIYVVHIDGVKVGHLGDLGHVLTDKQVEEVDGIDVLLVPVGGFYTIDPAEAIKVAAVIGPQILVPMHYKTSEHNKKIFGSLATLDDFLKEAGAEDAVKTDKLTVTVASLPDEMEIVVIGK